MNDETEKSLFEAAYNPDVLLCLANLSNDEVFTPPEIANQMIDMLPQELFEDPNTTFLDPCCKSGVFLREIAKRLIKGLEDKIPDLQERIEHIMYKQLYGIAITELTSLLSRRSLYCSKYPNSKYSISRFDDAEGNIRFKRINHTWKNERCIYCGASQIQYDRDLDLETHAYEFIHTLKPEEVFNMKFDVIIGNPPYQLSDGGNGASAKPIYNLFVEQAKKLKPKYITMIIPSRWFAGGKGLDSFRTNMLKDRHLIKIVDFANAKDCFPETSIGGGVNYFLWSRDTEDDCEVVNINMKEENSMKRSLMEYPVFVRYNKSISILHKVATLQEESIANEIYSRNPFGVVSSMRGQISPDNKHTIKLITSQGDGYIKKDAITKNDNIINHYKVMISKVTGEHAGEPDKNGQFRVLSRTEILNPQEVCTDSYLILYASNNKTEVENFYSYITTKFARFLLMQAVSSINLSSDKFQFVPKQDLTKKWTDMELYQKYNLTEEEISFIEKTMKSMNNNGGDE